MDTDPAQRQHRLLSPSLSSFLRQEERVIFVGLFTQGGALLALGYYLSGLRPF